MMDILYRLDSLRRRIKQRVQTRYFPTPKCCQCGVRHQRNIGWGHIDHPTCSACDAKNAALADEIMDEIMDEMKDEII
jgi:hypothetical protein